MDLFTVIHENIVPVLGAVILVETVVCIFLWRQLTNARTSLEAAAQAAEDAARAAAMAAPGGIDPEIVISLLRSGQPITLDTINEAISQTSY